jgi:SAM-dependent methyltransferase
MQPATNHEYVGKDLEAMSFAVNYHKWILAEFRPYLGDRIVEVGAGTGSFSALLVETAPSSLVVVEPSGMFEALRRNLSATDGGTSVEFHNAIFADVIDQIVGRGRPDSILYVNVLEHIEDDRRELELIHSALRPGGRCLIFVPALQSLYGPFDKRIGHFRRYGKRAIETKCAEAGFKVIKSSYFDMLRVLPWWFNYRVLRLDDLRPGAVSLYDRLAVPIMKRAEGVLPVPIGKNLLVVAEKE